MNKNIWAKELDETNRRLKKAKHAVAILEKARVDPVVRGTATIEYVEDRLRRGKIIINNLEEKTKTLRPLKTE